MKVLVIGGAGYIGSHVVKEMMKAGHKVTVFDNLSSGLRCNLFKENDFIYGNILIPADLEGAFAKGFDAFVHLAAFKAAWESMENPEIYSINNITGTLNIMNAAVKFGCKKMIFSSSAAVFGAPQYLPIDEKKKKNPENYYGFTKLEIERFMAWYDQLKGLRFAALRYFNAAGYDPEGEIKGLEQAPQNLLPRIMEVACGMRDELKVFGLDSIIEEIMFDESCSLLHEIINNKLSGIEKKIIKMYYGIGCREYNQKEIADILNIKQYTVSRIKNKAIDKLRKLID